MLSIGMCTMSAKFYFFERFLFLLLSSSTDSMLGWRCLMLLETYVKKWNCTLLKHTCNQVICIQLQLYEKQNKKQKIHILWRCRLCEHAKKTQEKCSFSNVSANSVPQWISLKAMLPTGNSISEICAQNSAVMTKHHWQTCA